MYSVRENEQAKSSMVRKIKDKQVICGYTCMDHDRIMEILNAPELKKGDEVIYHRVGAYSMTFGGAFIRFFPDVYVKKDTKIEMVREKMSVQDYFRMHSV